jgi:predicted AlkP superfamily phosphohydrolase/phosphomutase
LAKGTASCLKDGEFDLLWVTFVAPHIAGHQLWLDTSNSKTDPTRQEPKLLAGIYQEADEALGQILAALPPKTDLIVFSPNGMGPETSRADFLPAMLARVLEGHVKKRTAYRSSRSLWHLRAVMPTNLRALVATAIPDHLALRVAARLENAGVDRRTTRAFAVPSDGAGFVRLNLRGRERDGIVDPNDAEKLLEEIAVGLATFVEPSGENMISSFSRSSDLDVPGPKSSSLPDLVVAWSQKSGASLRMVTSPQFGEVLRDGVGSGRLGNHCEGAWVCVVPGGSRKLPSDLGPPRAIDLTATICDVMGVPHDDLPGRSLLLESV